MMKLQQRNFQQKKTIELTFFKVLTLLILAIFCNANLHAQDKVQLSDIHILNNTSWQGSLMYIDYSSGKETVLQTKMQLTIKGNKILVSTQYTNEPSANSRGAIKLKKGGSYFGNERVVKKSKLEDNLLKIVTMFDGSDNDKEATIYKTYLFNDKVYSVTKEVQLKGSDKKFIRNRYSYTRI